MADVGGDEPTSMTDVVKRRVLDEVVKDAKASIDGQYMVLAKGADMMMAQNCGVQIPDEANEHMQNFAVDGLRTLVVGRKDSKRLKRNRVEPPHVVFCRLRLFFYLI